MNTYTNILYQLVFHTKYNKSTLAKENRSRLFAYMAVVLQNMKCKSYIVGGIENHVHIIVGVHPTVCISDLVQKIKLSSSKFIRDEKLFPDFGGWQGGYGAFTYSSEAKKNLIRYVSNQEEHHAKKSWREELVEMLVEQEVDYDSEYLD